MISIVAKPSTRLCFTSARHASIRVARRSFQYSSIVAKDADSKIQSISPLAPLGVHAALLHAASPSQPVRPKIFDEFSLAGRVGVVSGGNRGLGLEMALALCEAGAKAVYCMDLPETPSESWEATREYVEAMGNGSRLEYVSGDVCDQQDIWDKVEKMADKEGRMDVCVAAAGILKAHQNCLDYPADEFREANRQLCRTVIALSHRYSLGNGSQYKRCPAHRSSCWSSDVEAQDTGKHHPDCFDEWEYYE